MIHLRPEKAKTFTLVTNSQFKNTSIHSVEETMSKMDNLNHTSFKKWVKDENNVTYLCTVKRKMILEYLEIDPISSMYALQWVIQDWSLETQAEFILKLFYDLGIKNTQFCNRVHSLVHEWSAERQRDLFSILLVGESPLVMSSFFSNWALLSKSTLCTSGFCDLVVPLVELFRWNVEQIGLFLVGITTGILKNAIIQEAMCRTIHSELEQAVIRNQDVFQYFEMLLEIILD
jgi:hypothetical protein